MKAPIAIGLLLAVLSGPFVSPAFADGKASTRNIFVATGAAIAGAVGLTNYEHKRKLKKEESAEQSRRQTSYRQWYVKKYGYAPDDHQFREWYQHAYGVEPA